MVEILDIAVRSRESHLYLLFFHEPMETGLRVQLRVERRVRQQHPGLRGSDGGVAESGGRRATEP